MAVTPHATAAPASSQCVLPVPDGGDVTPSPPNLSGHVSALGSGFIRVKPLGRNGSERIDYDRTTELYSAFGGDYEPTDFAVGQRVWVWFVNCERPAKAGSKAAYIMLFSRDPKDQPRK